MIISSDSDTEMNSMCSLPHVHSPSASSSIYGAGTYVLETPWHTKPHDIKQETDDLYNNDSGVSPSHFSDNNNASPISYSSDGQQSSPDSGNPDKSYRRSPSHDLCSDPNDDSVQTNATIGILARPILKMSPPYRPSSAEKQPDETSRSSVSDVEGVYEDDSLRKLQMALQKSEMMGSDLQSDSINGEKPLKCPLCEFSTVLRSDFNSHLKTHSNQVNCSQCEFTADNTDKLREHLKNIHDTTMEDEARRWAEVEEPGVNTPKINSQGKVKTYRCKQCDYTAVTKLDFWDHSRQHIRTERLLTCPKCPFVTEYKHHLEYHLRNHFGSKPFKCNQCPYSCVNKSMLNSHLKSHSTVYQFRCANCTYATKYCHSLKIHLRKYTHTPAMVLNPDGTPNPLPIIDIYGTRRGPKTKPRSRVKNSSSPPPIRHSPVSPIFPPPFTFMPNHAMPFPINAILNPFSTLNSVHCENHSSLVADELTGVDTDQSVLNINNNKESMNDYFARIVTMQQEILSRTQHNIEDTDRTPLDLSRPESAEQQTTTKSRRKGKAFKLVQHSEDVEDLDQSSKKKKRVIVSELNTEVDIIKTTPSPPMQSLSARYPLCSPSLVEKDIHSPVDPEPAKMSPKVDFSEPINNEFKSAVTTERKERWRNIKEIYDCAYCDLLFGDVVMYTMHMGYHGYQNPFTCNICGLQTSDKVQFFLHLFRVNHD